MGTRPEPDSGKTRPKGGLGRERMEQSEAARREFCGNGEKCRNDNGKDALGSGAGGWRWQAEGKRLPEKRPCGGS